MDYGNSSRYLLQYILSARGICHENALVVALMRLYMDLGCFDDAWQIDQWLHELHENINSINVKLNPLSYKVVQVRHGLGKTAVTMKNEQNFGIPNRGSELQQIVLPKSSRFYVYVNVTPSDETKLSTRFQPREIEFIKWCIETFCAKGSVVSNEPVSNSSIVVKEVHRIIQNLTGEPVAEAWTRHSTFAVGSKELSQYEDLSALEIEQLLVKLCEYKWLYRTNQGEFGMDVRLIAELQEFLVNEYSLSLCAHCDTLVTYGVMCGSAHCLQEEDSERTVWHVDCFQHHVTHVSKNCGKCDESLLVNGIYII
ncbi:hypothetical protein KAFR_0C06310 [Kazachstania africana CBS 2517]|uniref:Non-structural maintenance of chromosomes element 1 homolog n=1 Tax=Kazachstania africana (strain ATCC 22294 / BCRC 22015 / CBS 2517 / CECT 1963 / NBRC 1671 / NRRL Y-8276) TaxID=1071382 RepID=H2ATC7_KAZAF|nr:hypothetical protein KAFR_0C06310 [Kazachstania africana CBS 2517]CCF57627.1 hypothetical protein KAFR_0C06310 [Kazachstania africana CBS 2517]